MGLRAAFTFVRRAALRPHLIVPAALVTAIALLSPPAIGDASAQGFRMQSMRGGFSGGGAPSGFQMSRGMISKSALISKSGPATRPAGNVASGSTVGKGGTGMSGTRYPRPNGPVGETRPPTNDRYPPRRPRQPIPPIYLPGDPVVAVPGGPSSGPPRGISSGGGQPPAIPPGTGAPPVNWGRYVPNEVVVEVASSVSPRTMAVLARRHRLTQLETVNLQFSGTSIQRLRITDRRRSVPSVVRALQAEGVVIAAQPNLIASLQEASASPAAAVRDLEQYALARMRMPEAHALANGNRVLIAVIDSGADSRHPELAGMILDTFDAIGSGDRVHPHGTSIVGAIAARARLRGTAPGAHILVARAFGTHRTSMDGTTTDIVKAIDWAMQRGARIINMSFSGGRDPAVERRLTTARGRGIILVAAAGNAGPNAAPLYPAAHPFVIAVTATDDGDRIFRSANRGGHIAIAAPGVDLLLPTLDGGYRMTSGTSFSAAEITGVIALMLERNPGLTHDAVRRALMSTAHDLGAPGVDPEFGAGLVDAYQAVRSVLPAAPVATEVPATEALASH